MSWDPDVESDVPPGGSGGSPYPSDSDSSEPSTPKKVSPRLSTSDTAVSFAQTDHSEEQEQEEAEGENDDIIKSVSLTPFNGNPLLTPLKSASNQASPRSDITAFTRHQGEQHGEDAFAILLCRLFEERCLSGVPDKAPGKSKRILAGGSVTETYEERLKSKGSAYVKSLAGQLSTYYPLLLTILMVLTRVYSAGDFSETSRQNALDKPQYSESIPKQFQAIVKFIEDRREFKPEYDGGDFYDGLLNFFQTQLSHLCDAVKAVSSDDTCIASNIPKKLGKGIVPTFKDFLFFLRIIEMIVPCFLRTMGHCKEAHQNSELKVDSSLPASSLPEHSPLGSQTTSPRILSPRPAFQTPGVTKADLEGDYQLFSTLYPVYQKEEKPESVEKRVSRWSTYSTKKKVLVGLFVFGCAALIAAGVGAHFGLFGLGAITAYMTAHIGTSATTFTIPSVVAGSFASAAVAGGYSAITAPQPKR